MALAGFPTPEAELAYAVARGSMSLTLADISVLSRYRDLGVARQHIAELRQSITVWRHIRAQLTQRIIDVTRAHVAIHAPKNVILARAHDINAGQTIDEREVNAIVAATVWETMPQPPRRTNAR
jgi:hypothetical protein